MSERIQLPLYVVKETLEDCTPSFLVPGFSGFMSDYPSILQTYGLEDIDNAPASFQGLSHIPFNGLLFTPTALNTFRLDKHIHRDLKRKDHKINLERLIFEQGIVREIPVLFAELHFNPPREEDKELREYFFDLFDHIYLFSCNARMEIPQENPLMAEVRVQTPLVFAQHENPVTQWIEHMSRTKKICLRYEY
ncbi:hypothetical protein D6774_04905 [Candidatus Woesearchaeota archaeon]|nr:MAG: hypothetical protein D6774_04905 [Candidatus Woesearchaeota archaeon]